MSALALLEERVAVAAAEMSAECAPAAEVAEESAAGVGNMIPTPVRLPAVALATHGLEAALKWIAVRPSLQAGERCSVPRCQLLLEVVNTR